MNCEAHQAPGAGALPFMKSIEDAQALCQREQDPFYLTAFMIAVWLGQVALHAETEYAENKQARERQMQIGHAWETFLEVFGHAKHDEFPHVLLSLLRFAEYDDPQAKLLCRALLPFSLEVGTPAAMLAIGPDGLPQTPEKTAPLMRQNAQRWCDWVDALVHWQTHLSYHLLPASFDLDAEKRELAGLGSMQRGFAELNEFGQAWWHWHHGQAAERFGHSPKWPILGKVMATPLREDAGPAAVDQVVISFWPLVKRHNWTYRDLMTVARRVLPAPHRYPLKREPDLAAYCQNVLGLRKPPGPPGRSTPGGCPPGCETALKICCPAPGSS